MLVVEVSARHIHLCEVDAAALGIVEQLKDETSYRELTVKGEYATNVKLSLHCANGKELKATVLMPFREYSQVELSRTDCVTLGLSNIPRRMSGDLEGVPYIPVLSPLGYFTYVPVIVPAPHVHAPKQHKTRATMDVNVITGALFDVPIKYNDIPYAVLHLDTDTANAFDLKTGDKVLEGIF